MATDVDGDALTYSIKTGFAPTKGTVTFIAATGTFTYTPTANANGADTFTIVVSDGNGGVAEQVVTGGITPVNDAPVVVAAISVSTAEDSGSIAVNLLAEASDADQTDTLHVANVGSLPAYLILSGDALIVDTTSAALQGLSVGDTLPISVGFDIVDGNGGLVHQIANITIAGTNDGPTANADAGLSMATNGVLAISAASLLANDTDPDLQDQLSILSVQNAQHGTVAVSASGVVTFTADLGYNGAASFTYTVSDGHGGTSTADVSLTINSNVINGTANVDTLVGTAGADTINGYDGNDTLTGAAGNDVLNGGTGIDTMIGGTGNALDNVIAGNAGANVLSAGIGNDRLIGGAGADTLTGGVGSDTFVFATGLGKDIIVDFSAGAGVTDVIDLSLGTAFDTFAEVLAAASQVGANAVITFDLNTSITLQGVQKTALVADDFHFV